MEIIKKYFDDFNEDQLEKFSKLAPIYKEWNEKINVISRKDIDLIYEKHVLHSLSIVPICPFNAGMRIIDIGTGGGFPGIPLAIFYPEVHFTLVDSIGKKIMVVKEVTEALGLQNVTVINDRIENIKEVDFDFAVSRAVAPLKKLWQWARPIIKKRQSTELANGLICLKGGDLGQEISESMTRPTLWEISQIFPEPAFNDKFVVYVGK